MLGAAEGTSYDAGLKGEFLDRRLLASLAVFRAEQDNYAGYAGFDEASGLSYYAGVDVTSEKYELEFAGRVTDDWTVLAGFTDLGLEDADSDDARTFVPRRTFNLGTRYSPSVVPGLRLGGSVEWQDDIHFDTGAGVIRQDARAVWSAFASYAFVQHFGVALNVDDLTDEKYLTRLYWDQSFYAAPRSVTASFRVIH